MRIPSKHAVPQAVVSLVRFWLQTVFTVRLRRVDRLE